uniref:Uncharacterized protein n=1 Tax=Gasterosteus aculeatus TaxID=69293 RepID=G3Q2E8_GASAC
LSAFTCPRSTKTSRTKTRSLSWQSRRAEQRQGVFRGSQDEQNKDKESFVAVKTSRTKTGSLSWQSRRAEQRQGVFRGSQDEQNKDKESFVAVKTSRTKTRSLSWKSSGRVNAEPPSATFNNVFDPFTRTCSNLFPQIPQASG